MHEFNLLLLLPAVQGHWHLESVDRDRWNATIRTNQFASPHHPTCRAIGVWGLWTAIIQLFAAAHAILVEHRHRRKGVTWGLNSMVRARCTKAAAQHSTVKPAQHGEASTV